MQVFLTNEDLQISAMELDSIRINKQITEINQIILACLNNRTAECCGLDVNIGHINHPITQWYNSKEGLSFLLKYQQYLGYEYEERFNKTHMGVYTAMGFEPYVKIYPVNDYKFKVVYIKGIKNKNQIITTDNVYEKYKKLLTEKWDNDTKEPKWGNGGCPNWYKWRKYDERL